MKLHKLANTRSLPHCSLLICNPNSSADNEKSIESLHLCNCRNSLSVFCFRFTFTDGKYFKIGVKELYCNIFFELRINKFLSKHSVRLKKLNFLFISQQALTRKFIFVLDAFYEQ